MDESVELKVKGITYNQIESGVYALILEEPVSGTRLAIVIGYPEAQSIECNLQKVKTPRPLAHDVMASLLRALDATLLRVDIMKLAGGPYAGVLTLMNSIGERIKVDARSSDAVALAIRVGAPIFTTRTLLEKEGFIPKASTEPTHKHVTIRPKESQAYPKHTVEQLEEMLARYVAEENYEEASKVKAEIDRRKNS